MNNEIDKKRSIGKAAKELNIRAHSIRFWESKFPQIKPKIGVGGRRYYFDKDLLVLSKIKSLLYDEGYTIAGLQKFLTKRKNNNKEKGLEFLLSENQSDVVNQNLVSLKDEEKERIDELVKKIEFNLDRLSQILESK